MRHTIFGAAYASLLIAASGAAQAAVLNNGDFLTINSGVASYDGNGNQVNVSGGSWFAIDGNLNNQIIGTEKTAISAIPGGGIPLGGQVMAQVITPIDAWIMYGYVPGYDYLTSNVTGDTTTGLNFSGWTINYNGSPVVPYVDYGAWTPSNCATLGCAGVSFVADTAAISWSGVYGDSYSLWYSWNFWDSPGAFVPTRYLLHLEGTVQSAVPVPAAAWLFGSGLLGLLGVARRKAV